MSYFEWMMFFSNKYQNRPAPAVYGWDTDAATPYTSDQVTA